MAATLFSRRAHLPKNTFMGSGMEMLSGGTLLLIASLLTGEVQRFDLAAVPPISWLAYLYLLVFGSIIGFSAYIYLLKTVSAAKASTYSYVNPVIAVFLGWLLIDEPVTIFTFAGTVLIIAGVYGVFREKAGGHEKEPRQADG